MTYHTDTSPMTPVPPPEDFDADEYRILLSAWLKELWAGRDPRVTMRDYMI